MQLHLFKKFSCFFLFWLHLKHTELPWLGIKPVPTAVELEVLTVGLPGTPPTSFFLYVFCFVCGYLVFPILFVKKTVLSPLNDFGTLVKNHLMMYMRVYFWAFFSVCLVYMPIFMPIPHSSYECNKFWNQKVKSPPTLFFFQNYVGSLKSLEIPWWTQIFSIPWLLWTKLQWTWNTDTALRCWFHFLWLYTQKLDYWVVW